MKKIKILLLLITFSLVAFATDTDRNRPSLSKDQWYTIDKSNVNIVEGSDSIVWIWKVLKKDPYEVTVIIDADSIAGLDTTLQWSILGRNNTSQSWTSISTGTIAGFNDTIVEVKSHATNSYVSTSDTSSSGTIISLTQASTSLYYRYIGLRLSVIDTDTDTGGTGYTVDNIELLLRRRGL